MFNEEKDYSLIQQNNADDDDNNNNIKNARILQRSMFLEDGKTIKDIIENKNFNINTLFANGLSPLMYAINLKSIECVDYLLRNGAQVDFLNCNNDTSLNYLLKYYSDTSQCIRNIFLLLLKYNSNVNQPDLYQLQPLQITFKLCKIYFFEQLLKWNGNCEITDENGNTFLHLSVIHQQYNVMIDILLKNYVNINARNMNNQTAFDIAVEQHNLNAIEKLLNYNVVFDYTNKNVANFFNNYLKYNENVKLNAHLIYHLVKRFPTNACFTNILTLKEYQHFYVNIEEIEKMMIINVFDFSSPQPTIIHLDSSNTYFSILMTKIDAVSFPILNQNIFKVCMQNKQMIETYFPTYGNKIMYKVINAHYSAKCLVKPLKELKNFTRTKLHIVPDLPDKILTIIIFLNENKFV